MLRLGKTVHYHVQCNICITQNEEATVNLNQRKQSSRVQLYRAACIKFSLKDQLSLCKDIFTQPSFIKLHFDTVSMQPVPNPALSLQRRLLHEHCRLSLNVDDDGLFPPEHRCLFPLCLGLFSIPALADPARLSVQLSPSFATYARVHSHFCGFITYNTTRTPGIPYKDKLQA